MCSFKDDHYLNNIRQIARVQSELGNIIFVIKDTVVIFYHQDCRLQQVALSHIQCCTEPLACPFKRLINCRIFNQPISQQIQKLAITKPHHQNSNKM